MGNFYNIQYNRLFHFQVISYNYFSSTYQINSQGNYNILIGIIYKQVLSLLSLQEIFIDFC